MIQSRRLAKAVYWAAGHLSRIKTYRRMYEVVSFTPVVTKPVGRRWLSCELSMTLLKLSMRLDWDHWDHWALDHTGHPTVLCPGCGAPMCPDDDDWSADESPGLDLGALWEHYDTTDLSTEIERTHWEEP